MDWAQEAMICEMQGLMQAQHFPVPVTKMPYWYKQGVYSVNTWQSEKQEREQLMKANQRAAVRK